MKYGRTGCAVVRDNGDVWNEQGEEDCTQTGDQLLQKAKTLKGVLEEEAIYSYKRNLKKMEEEVKRNIANGMLSLSYLLLVKS